MPSVTLRDIPDDLLNKIRILSERERRSLNKELLVILEEGIDAHARENDSGEGRAISPDIQAKIWEQLAGKWEDSRATEEIIRDIHDARTHGREVSL